MNSHKQPDILITVYYMKRIFLGLAIHNHQPLGNFPWVFEDAYRRAYLPMLEALARHPSICAALHYSGCLVDWLLDEHPEFFDILQQLHKNGQVEIMGGGYYEPILPSIPVADRSGQIAKMGDFIQERFGMRPAGMWLAERVWEPSLPTVLAGAGISWTLVDDTAFKMVGKDDAGLLGYFNTEDQGSPVKVFPISKYLRYSIPWHKVEDVIAYLRENASEEGNKIVVLGDDGEKFGIWPETDKHCWEEKWVDDFFTALEQNSEWLITIKPGEYAAVYPPAGRICLPCASYDEMMEWSLPPEKANEYTEFKHRLEEKGRLKDLRYVQSGFWRNFLVKYPEINRMHKKMLLVHEKVYRALTAGKADCGLDYLWRAQCNCPYWHGVFGGIYLTDIRAMTYSNLIRAEVTADSVLAPVDSMQEIRELDFDGDGNNEVLVDGKWFNLYVSPAEGGSIFEWDLRKQGYNLLSTMSRRPESYHSKLLDTGNRAEGDSGENIIKNIHDGVRLKEGQSVLMPVYDKLPRSCMLDHFLGSDVTITQFMNNACFESTGFAGARYQYRVEKSMIMMQRQGEVRCGQEQVPLRLEKAVIPIQQQDMLNVDYWFANKGEAAIDTVFACEWNFNLLGGGHNDSAYYRVEGAEIGDTHLDSWGEIREVEQLVMGNSYLGIEVELKLERPLTLWRFPVESLSSSEGGVERVYQANCLVILVPLQLAPGGEFRFKYSWHVKDIRP